MNINKHSCKEKSLTYNEPGKILHYFFTGNNNYIVTRFTLDIKVGQ